MKRAINIFTAFILTIVLAFGSQVPSAFAYAYPDNFILEAHSPMEVHVEPGLVKATYKNDSPEDIQVFAEAYTNNRQSIAVMVPSGQSLTEEFFVKQEDDPFVFFINESYSPIEVSIQ